MGLFFYNKIGSIISIGDLPTTNIIEPFLLNLKKIEKVVDKVRKVGIIVRVENNSGPLVKGLRHRLFTAVTRVQIPYGLWYVAVETLDEKSFKKVSKKC